MVPEKINKLSKNISTRKKEIQSQKFDFRKIYGLILFYILVFIILPKLIYILPFELFAVLYSNVDMFGDILTTALPKYFGLTYNNDPDNFISYLSTSLINLTAISGILFQGAIAIHEDGLVRGLSIMIIMFLITYLLPTLIIPYLQNHFSRNLDKEKKNDTVFKIFIGFSVAGFFIIIEYFLLKNFIKIAKSTQKINNKTSTIEKIIHKLFFQGLQEKLDEI